MSETGSEKNAEAGEALFEEGNNCWKISRADQLGWCIDGEDYFGAIRNGLEKARHEILIVGWDIDSRTELIRDKDHPHYPSELCDVLQELVKSRQSLCVRVLSWDFAFVYFLERELLPPEDCRHRWRSCLFGRAGHHQVPLGHARPCG